MFCDIRDVVGWSRLQAGRAIEGMLNAETMALTTKMSLGLLTSIECESRCYSEGTH